MKHYDWLDAKNRQLLDGLAKTSPFFKYSNGLEANILEGNLITANASKKSDCCKALMDEMTLRNFNFSKSILTVNYRYNLYNMAIVFLFVNKIEDIEKNQINQNLDHESLIEVLFLHLKDEFLAQSENTSKFFAFFTKTGKNILKFYCTKIQNSQNNLRKTELLKKEFIILIQYLSSENHKLGEIAKSTVEFFIAKFPFLFISQKVLSSLESLINGLSGSLNKMFGSDTISINPPYYPQGLAFSKISKENTEKLSVLLSFTLALFLNSKIQNDFLTRKFLIIFFKLKNSQTEEMTASLSFFNFLDKIDDFQTNKTNKIEENIFVVGIMNPKIIEKELEKLSKIIRKIKQKNQ